MEPIKTHKEVEKMETITTRDILRQIKYTYKPGEMRLLIAEHQLTLRYAKNGRCIECERDGEIVENCNYTLANRMLKKLSQDESLKIKLLHPQAYKWRRIRLDDARLEEWIDDLVANFLGDTQALGCTYLHEALYDICKKHMTGKVVSVDRTLKMIAKSRGILGSSVAATIRSAVISHFQKAYDRLTPECQQYFTEEWCSSPIFVRQFSHYVLDCICKFSST